MSGSRHVVYVSDVVPGPGHGGRIVVDRHLRRLAADGHSVTVITPFGQAAAAGPWREVRLPARRGWWPPFRPAIPLLANFRAWAWRRELRAAGVPRADAVLTVCWGNTSWLAAAIARAARAPLVAVVHDWWREAGTPADTLVGRHVCAAARTVFAVSAEMQTALRAECARPVDLLYPIPAARALPFAAWRDDYRAPSVAHVGTLQPYHEEFLFHVSAQLHALGGRLLLLCPRDNPTAAALARRCPNLVRQDFFPDNADALRWIASHASALVVMYRHGLDAGDRPPTGFPSRFVEFSQLGLPVLLAAPTGNPIRSWAASRSWTGRCAPTDLPALTAWLRSTADREAWTSLAAETRRAATTDFDPERIHAQLAAALFP